MIYNAGMKIEECRNTAQWNDFIDDQNGHPLQKWGWGELKSNHNWQASRLFVIDDEKKVGAAQVLTRKIPVLGKTLAYVPRGPVCNEKDREAVLAQVAQAAKTQLNAIGIVVEPDWEENFQSAHWRKTDNTILIPRTLILDLHKSEDELLSDMNKKSRQYIRKSSREGVEFRPIETVDDFNAIMDIYEATSQRANFAIHSREYYRDAKDLLKEDNLIFAALYENELVSFVWLAKSKDVAFELYGGMNEIGQKMRANYGLKWYAITECKRQGIKRYDMNGLLNDGISDFKKGFAKHENMLIGTLEKPLSPLYSAWNFALPLAKKTLRFVAKIRGKN